jgi:hypothetical protein
MKDSIQFLLVTSLSIKYAINIFVDHFYSSFDPTQFLMNNFPGSFTGNRFACNLDIDLW